MELTPQELHRLGERALDFIRGYWQSLDGLPVAPADIQPEQLRKLLDEPLPRQGQGVEPAFQDFVEKIAANSVRVGHPRFLAWIRAAPLGAAVYAEALAAALNQSVSVWEGAPAATEVELRVLEWLKELSGFAPSTSATGGILTSGGSSANLTCLLAARAAAAPEARQEGLAGHPPLALYLTDETHYCITKAAEMMGLGRRGIRAVPMDAALRMDPAALLALLRADRQAGWRPLAVVATLGAVNTGACDDLLALARVCREEGVWLHVDGAYGGLVGMVPEKRALAAGLEQADSLAFDPHKILFVPFEAGCALVRNPDHQAAAFAAHADYLPNTDCCDTEAPFNFRDAGPQLSRSFRALKIYLTLKIYGAEALAAETGRQYRLASTLAEKLAGDPEFELLAPVQLGIVAFRYRGQLGIGADEALDGLNLRLAAEARRGGRVFFATTRVRGRVALRVCFVSFRTQEPDLDILLDEVRALGRRLVE